MTTWAVLTMMSAVAVYMALFRREPQGRTRGDFLGGIFYSSNWYQIFVGQGYTANEAFVPLRHLWSLAVEEQFYLIWPLIMTVLLARRGGRDLTRLAVWFAGISVAISARATGHCSGVASARTNRCTSPPSAAPAAC